MATPESGGSLFGSPASSTGRSRLTPPHEASYPITPPPPPIFNVPNTAVNNVGGLLDNDDEWDKLSSEVNAFNAGSVQSSGQTELTKPTANSFAVCYEGLQMQPNQQLTNINPNTLNSNHGLAANQSIIGEYRGDSSTSPTAAIVHSQKHNFPVDMLILPDSDNASWPSVPTRYLKISQLPIEASPEKLYKIFQGFGNLSGINMGKLSSEGVVFVAYYDLRDSMKAQRGSRDSWLVQFCKPTSLITLSADLAAHTPDNESEIICYLNPTDLSIARSDQSSLTTTAFFFRQMLDRFGEIYEFRSLNTVNNPTFVLQYYDVRDAWEAVQKLDNQCVQGFRIRAQPYRADVTLWSKATLLLTIPTVALPKVKQNRHDAGDTFLQSFGNLSVSALGQASHYGTPDVPFTAGGVLEKQGVNRYICSNTSPSEHLMVPTGRMGNKSDSASNSSHGCQNHLGAPQSLTRPSSRTSSRGASASYKSNHLQVPGKNLVDLQSITLGIDTRTTIMIRNIPNKVDQQMLKEYIDETSATEYDFLYLRIDFKNLCNVGYAFLNFVDPLSIVKFTRARAGTKWNKFNSEKVAEVSYANIQGKEALIEKFRNSSVMDQDPSYRPRIFQSSGPLVGQEMPFPAANNLPRKLRSMAAAQQIGLYNPKHSGKPLFRQEDE